MDAAAGTVEDSEFEETLTQDFKDFEDYCCKAYNLLRDNSKQLINLFLIMLSAGMPELSHKEEIENMEKALKLQLSAREAQKDFKDKIRIARKTFTRRVDNTFHNFKQIRNKEKASR